MLNEFQKSCRLLIDLLTKKTWRPEFELFAKGVVSKHFTHFMANYYLKTWQEKQEYNLTEEICYLEYIILQPQTALNDLQNIPIKMHYRYELNSNRGKHVLACF